MTDETSLASSPKIFLSNFFSKPQDFKYLDGVLFEGLVFEASTGHLLSLLLHLLGRGGFLL